MTEAIQCGWATRILRPEDPEILRISLHEPLLRAVHLRRKHLIGNNTILYGATLETATYVRAKMIMRHCQL